MAEELTSQRIAERITFEGWTYLATGDIAWTKMGKSLGDMFSHFQNDEDAVALDFARWLVAKLEAQELEKHSSDCAKRAGYSCDCDYTYPPRQG